ncbi:MAG TPA: hypothetical protein PLQ21_03550 [Candidatus Kapabacteria bacterium]|jgi:hypothetical protein|nr:hypothetical protein [Candidatus Kapabacteria bacterium]
MKISNFYDDDDMPSMEARQRMWNRISQSLSTKKQAHFFIETRSFFYGMVASVLITLCGVGLYSTVGGLVSSENENKETEAYKTAIREFEKVVPSKISLQSNQYEIIQDKKQHIAMIDKEIDKVNKEMSSPEFAELRRITLRQLYHTKLSIILSMIDNGEMEL